MRKLTLRNQKGFTLIELLAVMAIVAVLAGIISVAVAGSGQTSRDTQTKQDGTTVETAVANYFGNQQGTETRQPLVVEVLGQRNIEEVISNKWPEKYITEVYPLVFPQGVSSEIGSIFFEDKDGEISDLRVRGLLQRFNAVDFDILSDGGFLTTFPKSADETSRGFNSYLWLLEKSITSSSNKDISSRVVAVFKLQSVNSTVGSEIVDLTYRRLFGGLFADAIPVASSFTVVTDEDTPTTITLVGTDFDTCDLTFTIEEGTTNGLLSPLTNNDCVLGEPNSDSASITYVPDLNFNGEDSFTYSVIDGNGDDIGTVTVTINVVNDAPVVTLSTLDDIEVDEDALGVSIDVAGVFADVDIATNADNLTYTASFNTNPSVVSTNVGPTALGSILNLQYLPDQHDTAQITVRATDTSLDFAEDTFTVVVNSVNDAPSFIVGPHIAVSEDVGASSISGWATDIKSGPLNESAQVLNFIVDNDNPLLFSSQPAVLPDGTLTFTPVADAHGVAAVTVELHDDGGTARGGVDTSAPVTFNITVRSVNDAPDFVKGAGQGGPEDGGTKTVANWATGIEVGPANESGQLLTMAFNVTDNTNPSLFSTLPAVDSDDNLTYTPAPDAHGDATITLVLNDGGGTTFGGVDTSVAKTFEITVNSVNDTPSFTVGDDQVALEDSGAQTVTNWAVDISPGADNETGQILTFDVSNNALFSVQPAVDSNGTLTYTPVPDANGVANLTIDLEDNGGGSNTSASQPFTITITAVNDPPVATGQNLGTDEDTSLGITLSGTDTDGTTLTIFAVTLQPIHGDLSGTAPNLTYIPDADYNGSDSFKFTVSDGFATSSPATISIDITAINDQPDFTLGPDQNINEGSGPQSVTGWVINFDPGALNESGQVVTIDVADNDNLGLFETQPAVSTSETLTYTPKPGITGIAVITLNARDDGGTVDFGDNDTGAPRFLKITVAGPFSNGGFEDGLNSWTINDGDIDVIPSLWTAFEGSQSIDLNGFTPGTISQTFDTVAGTQYLVQFRIAGNTAFTSVDNKVTMEVSVTGGTPIPYSFDVTGETLPILTWVEESFEFTASDITTTLTFKSTTLGASGPALDNVRVTIAPP